MNKNGLIYPKEYSAYMIFTIFIFVLCLFGIVILTFVLDESSLGLEDIIIVFAFILLLVIFPTYLLVGLYKIIREKVFIEIGESYLTYKGLFKTVSVNYIELREIRVQTFRGGSAMKFFCNESTTNGMKPVITIPPAWFSLKDLRKVVDVVKKNNRHIDLNGISKIV